MLGWISDKFTDHGREWINGLGIAVLIGVIGFVGMMQLGIVKVDGSASTTAAYVPPPTEEAMNVYQKLAAGQLVHYLVIGDSIGQGDGASADEGWSDKLHALLREAYHATAYVKRYTIGGGIALGGWADYAKQPQGDYDLVFLCFGQNDQGAMSADQFGPIYENLIQRIRWDHPLAEIITITESSLQADDYPNVIRALSDHYGLRNIDTRTAFRNAGIPYNQLTDDGVHPNAQGYALYAKQIFETLQAGVTASKAIGTMPAAPLYPASVDFNERQTFSDWTTLDGFSPSGPGLIVASEPGSTAQASFRGDFLGLDLVFQDRGAIIDIYVDDKPIRTIDTYWFYPYDVNWKKFVADQLGDGTHTLRIEVRSDNNAASKGTIAQIRGIIAEPA